MPDSNKGCWYVVEIRFRSPAGNVHGYTCILMNGSDIVLSHDGLLCLFRDPACARNAIEMYSKSTESVAFEIDEIAGTCDLIESTRLVTKSDIDEGHILLHTINILMDLLKTIEVPVPVEHKRPLYAVADFCTFDPNIKQFFSAHAYTRQEVAGGLSWCEKVLATKSLFVDG